MATIVENVYQPEKRRDSGKIQEENGGIKDIIESVMTDCGEDPVALSIQSSTFVLLSAKFFSNVRSEKRRQRTSGQPLSNGVTPHTLDAYMRCIPDNQGSWGSGQSNDMSSHSSGPALQPLFSVSCIDRGSCIHIHLCRLRFRRRVQEVRSFPYLQHRLP